ncbi:MAG: DUF4876 domain-containing protein [Rikenellaceae bacterium]|jgi:hypothetical protein|nr:DUF4876 domain-containing protein [Rikenellaceae bacterium]
MKKLLVISAVLSAWVSCGRLDDVLSHNPYGTGVRTINLQLTYPDAYESELGAGATVVIQNPSAKTEFRVQTDGNGRASVKLQYGVYRISVSHRGASVAGAVPLFNRNVDQLKVTDGSSTTIDVVIDMIVSYAGQLVIGEVYYRGCSRPGPPVANNQYDKYIAIYNNSDQVAYLDSVCLGTVGAYNAPTSASKWIRPDGSLMDTIPINSAVWQFPSSTQNPGRTFPLQPGEKAVVALCAAIDHTLLWPNSVNLNVSGYWVTYDNRYYTNVNYHPAPGVNLAGHYLSVLKKIDAANAYAFSVTSPAPVIFRIPAEVSTAYEYVNDPANLRREPGATSGNYYAMIPGEWVLDGVECFDAVTKHKRVPAIIDVSYVLLTDSYMGKTVHRKVDDAASAEMSATLGRPTTVYRDTNNSSEDFEVRDTQSIKQ